jgi:hypothetical protein
VILENILSSGVQVSESASFWHFEQFNFKLNRALRFFSDLSGVAGHCFSLLQRRFNRIPLFDRAGAETATKVRRQHAIVERNQGLLASLPRISAG